MASGWCTAALVLLLFASYFYSSFSEDPYHKWLQFLFHIPAGLIIYSSLIISLIFSVISTVMGRMHPEEVSPESIKAMDASFAIKTGDAVSLQNVAEWMMHKGFSVDRRVDGIFSVKGRMSFLPGAVLKIGIVILMVSLLFSMHLRKAGELKLHEGESGSFLGSKILLSNIKADLPGRFLKIGEKDAFSQQEVTVLLLTPDRAYHVNTGLPEKIAGRYYRVVHIGFSHLLTVMGSAEYTDKRIDLDVLPPGRTDTVELPSHGLSLAFSLEPEKKIRKGLITGKEYNLVVPLYTVAVKSKQGSAEAKKLTLRAGERVSAEKRTIVLGSRSLFVMIDAVHDPALLWVYTGLLVSLSGIVLLFTRLFWYERKMAVFTKPDTILIGYSEEFFKKWGIQKCHGWREDLEQLIVGKRGTEL
jgi:hypothetical protein